MEIDIDHTLEESWNILKKQGLSHALEYVMSLEKQARTESNLTQSTTILVHVVDLCASSHSWTVLQEQIASLSKKRGQSKQAISKMIQKAISIAQEIASESEKSTLLKVIHDVTLGKIYVEVEHAQATKLLAQIKESQGSVREAANLMFELQVETYGSMEFPEKVDYILEQMRLGLVIKDFTQTQIVSKRIQPRHLQDDPNLQQKKLEYYQMMILLALHDKDYLQCAQYYNHIYDTPTIQNDQDQLINILEKIILFTLLSPHTNEQSDLKYRLYHQNKHIMSIDKSLHDFSLHRDLLKAFLTQELMRWPIIEKLYCPLISKTISDLISTSDESWLSAFKDRVMEHNLRTISIYYQRITMKRLSSLLGTDLNTIEQIIGRLVVEKIIYARLDRPSGIVSFVPKKDPEDILDAWSDRVKRLLELIVKANHLIAKEDIARSVMIKSD